MAEIRDLDAWLGQAKSLPRGLAPRLEAERMAVALRIADTLGAWVAMGGHLALTTSPPRADAPGALDREPAPAPPRALPAMRASEAPLRVEAPRVEAPRVEAPRVEVPRVEPPRVEPPRVEPPRVEPPPRVEAPARIPDPPSEPRLPATGDALASLKQRLEGGAGFDDAPPVAWTNRLDEIVPPLLEALDDEREITRLRVTISACEQWSIFPHDIQRMLIGLTATRLRMLQDERHVESRRLDGFFSQLTAYSARERPGAVHGLARNHRPFRDTWREDADAWADRLRALLTADDEGPPSPSAQKTVDGLERLAREVAAAPTADTQAAVRSQLVREVSQALRNGLSARNRALVKLVAPHADAFAAAEFRALRRAIRDDAEAADEEAGTGERAQMPDDWAWWTRTRGRRAVMVGGSPRELNRARLEQTFQFASLEWEGTEFKRNSLQALRNRVSAGGIDLVLVLRSFVGHDADQILLPACRERGIDWVHVEQGYGTARVRAAIERFLDP